MCVQWNLSKIANCGPVLVDLYREVSTEEDRDALVLFGTREASCF